MATVDELLTLLTGDLIGEIAPPGAQWGIFSGGSPVVVADTVLTFDFKSEWSISDYPVERGAFESYDKVFLPYDARFRFVSGGSLAKREGLLASIQAIAPTTNLYDVVTPECVWISATVSHYSLQRSARDVGLLSVDVWMLQVNQNATVPSGSAQPDGAAQINDGAVQTNPASATQTSAVNAAPDFNVLSSSALP